MLRVQRRMLSMSARPTVRLSNLEAPNAPYQGNGVLAVVREQHGMWERRVPLVPKHVRKLVMNGYKVLVQPCSRRIFSDNEFAREGAIITDDIDEASLAIGVKQMPAEAMKDDKSYMFFSHTIKAQPPNMPLLDSILENKSRLFDYECITAEGRDDTKRVVAFGKYAGMAGMIDGVQGLGQRLLADGYSTPLLTLPMSFMHPDMQSVKERMKEISDNITANGLPKDLAPLVVVVTGTGNVSQGAKDILEMLPHTYVTAQELPTLADEVAAGKRDPNIIYAVQATQADMVRHKDGKAFDRVHYYAHPEEYEPIFHETIMPYTTMLVNGIYWEARFPRLLTNEQLLNLRKSGNTKFSVLSDVSCDIDGSVELLSRSTTIEKPYFTYIPEEGREVDGIDDKGVMVLGVDNLPTELPKDASNHFSNCLVDLIPPLLSSKGSENADDMEDIPAELRRACIASHGNLLPKWAYINKLREQNNTDLSHNLSTSQFNDAMVSDGKVCITNVELRGHLFDTGLINRVLDLLESRSTGINGINFSVSLADVRPNTMGTQVPSRVLLRVSGSAEAVEAAAKEVQHMVEMDPSAKGSTALHAPVKSDDGASEEVPAFSAVSVKAQKRVVLFGSGRVAKPVLKLLDTHDDLFVTIASDDAKTGQELVNLMKGGEMKARFQHFRFPDSEKDIHALIRDCDLAISLLPATMHMPIAEEAVRAGRHLVTASYTSPAMRDLHEKAKEAGVVLLNEVGLDPGIDHMLIMQSIDSIHERGGQVTELVSLCGGIPDPVAADNPLLYKFSWSPRGVLTAARNSAQFLQDGVLNQIDGPDLLKNANASNRFPTMRLEVLPNRNSLEYRDLYNVPKVATICRGTFRYEGWANVMIAFKLLGLMELDVKAADTWSTYLSNAVAELGETDSSKPLYSRVQAVLEAEKAITDVPAAMHALTWLGLISQTENTERMVRETPLDSLCSVLEEKLQYKENERDMVAMFHTVVGTMPDGTVERHTSRLLDFGVTGAEGDSAMSKTVGYTTGAAAELLLYGDTSELSPGVMIPTTKEVYTPLLNRLQDFGITWNESIEKP